MDAPQVSEIAQQATVKIALQNAWEDSATSDAENRHEEGGWIYYDGGRGAYTIERARSGGQAFLDLSNPPTVEGAFLVATFHTHPKPSAEGWVAGPSDADIRSAWVLGVPCIIRADDGVHFAGPVRRRGGLRGNVGYPD